MDESDEEHALGVNLFHDSISSGYVGIQQHVMYWPEQAQPLAERYILWFHFFTIDMYEEEHTI
jgi:hypothetical protein